MVKMSRKKDQELNEAKLRFFTNITHEFRTPLTLILSPLSEILGDPNLKENLRERLNYIDKNAKRLLKLINQLIDFRKAEHNSLQLQVVSKKLVPFLEEIFISFHEYAKSKNINFTFKAPENDIMLTFDREKMETVIFNLISNAFKFTPHRGQIKVSLYTQQKFCIICIKDSGKGISKKNQKRIFSRFFQIQDEDPTKYEGSGIGLSLSEKIVNLHQGQIFVKSKLEKGSEFEVRIPLGSGHFNKNDFKNSEYLQQHTSEIEKFIKPDNSHKSKTAQKKQLETLLIIDDNIDIRNYLETLFKLDYKILIAKDGKEGKEIAEKYIPDIIICDVMMPEMDGLQMCKLLKSQISTSHIPILLLTARTSTIHELDGLETGADDYVKKPFDAKIIKSRVTNQLQNRKKFRTHLKNKIRFETDTNIVAVNFEEKFIDKILKIVENHLQNSNFNAESLAKEVFMSQSTLYRKIKSLTGMTISSFIRSIRLKKASEILLTEEQNLSTIAYMVGFSDYKYFKKSFKNQFGLSPKEFLESKMGENKPKSI